MIPSSAEMPSAIEPWVKFRISLTLVPPASVPVNVTVGGGSSSKFLAKSIESSENGSPIVCDRVMNAGENAATPLAPA